MQQVFFRPVQPPEEGDTGGDGQEALNHFSNSLPVPPEHKRHAAPISTATADRHSSESPIAVSNGNPAVDHTTTISISTGTANAISLRNAVPTDVAPTPTPKPLSDTNPTGLSTPMDYCRNCVVCVVWNALMYLLVILYVLLVKNYYASGLSAVISCYKLSVGLSRSWRYVTNANHSSTSLVHTAPTMTSYIVSSSYLHISNLQNTPNYSLSYRYLILL